VKTEPISFRPSQSLDARLDAMRQRTGIPKSRLVEQLADEAERSRRYPGVAFRGPDHRREAWLIGSPFDVWEVIQAWQDLGEDTEAVQEQLSLSARQLKLALAYYGEFAEQIDADLALARRTLGELQSAYPFIEVLRIED
jgi:uncharacterized protein (DUF433 family)